MVRGVMVFLSLLVLSGAALGAVWVLAHGLVQEPRHPDLRRWLLRWSLKGLLAPLVLWALMNIGLSWQLQPFMPQVQIAQNYGSGWFGEYLQVLGFGAFVVSTYWTAVTLAWVLYETGQAADRDARKQLKSLCLTCFIGMLIPALLLAYAGGWPLLGLAGIALVTPMAGYGAGVLHQKKTPPMYARAIARMKFGKYSEAEWEIIRELEKSEEDFEGWMMLATLYANNFHDLREAEQTVLDVCDQAATTPSQLSVALHRLADWHLQAGEPDAARRALHMICHRLPGTHLAHMAQLRINQLPASAAELRRQQTASVIPLPALGDSMDQEPKAPLSESKLREAADEANACVELLKADPNNVSARERLARIFAERLEQPVQGIEQANLLLDIPEQPELRRAEWLGMIAAWQIRYQQDVEAGRATLQRLIQEYPHTPQALSARRRLQLMDTPTSPGDRTPGRPGG